MKSGYDTFLPNMNDLDHSGEVGNVPLIFPACTAAMDFYADSSHARKVARVIFSAFKQRFLFCI